MWMMDALNGRGRLSVTYGLETSKAIDTTIDRIDNIHDIATGRKLRRVPLAFRPYGKMKLQLLCFFLIFLMSSTGQTLNGSNDAVRCKEVPFGVAMTTNFI